MTNHRCILTFTRPTTPMYPSFKSFHERVRNGQTDGRTDGQTEGRMEGGTDNLTDLHTSSIHHIFVFPNSNAQKTAPFPRFYKWVRDGRTDGHTDIYRDARTHLKMRKRGWIWDNMSENVKTKHLLSEFSWLIISDLHKYKKKWKVGTRCKYWGLLPYTINFSSQR